MHSSHSHYIVLQSDHNVTLCLYNISFVFCIQTPSLQSTGCTLCWILWKQLLFSGNSSVNAPQLCQSLLYYSQLSTIWCTCLLFLSISCVCKESVQITESGSNAATLRFSPQREMYAPVMAHTVSSEGHLFCHYYSTNQLPLETPRDVRVWTFAICSPWFNSAVWGGGARCRILQPPCCARLFHFADLEPLVSMGDGGPRRCHHRRCLIKNTGGSDQRRKYCYPADLFSRSLRFNLCRPSLLLQAERRHTCAQ